MNLTSRSPNKSKWNNSYLIGGLFSLVLFFSSLLCYAQAEFGQGLPITIKVNTPINLAFGSVEFAGNVLGFDAEPPLVIVEVNKPDGSMDKISGRADASTGNYILKYSCKALGNYKAIAYAIDKKLTAEITFTVQANIELQKPFATIKADVDNSYNSLNTLSDNTLKDLANPAEIAEVKTKLAELKQSTKKFSEHIDAISKSTDVLLNICKKYPAANDIAAADLGKLASILQQESEMLKQVTQDLKKSSTASDDCKKLNQLSEGCAAFSTAMNVTSGGILKVGASIFIDKVWPYIEKNGTEKYKINLSEQDHFAFIQGGKTALTALDGLKELKTKSFGAGMAGDLTQYVSNTIFSQYCTEYKGTISGTYGVESRSEGKMYLQYKLKFEGTASLFCKNTELKKGIPKLNGYMEANVTDMQFTDDVWAVEDHKDWDEIKYTRIKFPVVGSNASQNDDLGFGAVARAALPGSFYFPLEARIVEEKMVIKIMPALNDFTPAFQNRTLVIARAKYGAKNLSGAVFEYPIQKAFFIVARSVRQGDDAPTFSLDIKKMNGGKELEKQYLRTEKPSDDTTVDFEFNIKLIEKQGTKK